MNLLVPKFIKYQLYLLQLENYELGRYWKLLFKKGLFPSKKQPLRKDLVWSAKAKALMLMAIGLHLISILLIWLWIPVFAGMVIKIIWLFIVCVLLFVFYFLLFTIALALLWPFDYIAKQIIISKAKSRVENLKDIKMIGIAGSYGKTTMKQVLALVLSAKFKVQSTPESVNTPVGIARWVLKNLTPSPVPPLGGTPSPARGEGNMEIALVEMGEHYSGDIEYLCKITPPDFAVVTGINEAHLERMKNLENITNTIFEVAGNAKPGATILLNGDDKNVMDNYKKYVWPDHRLAFYGQQNKELRITNYEFNAEKLGWDAEIDGFGKVFINLLGEYAISDVQAAIIIAKQMGMSDTEIKIGISNIKPVEHRLQPINSANNVLIIDDSYNGNPAGAEEAIKVLSRFVNRRKIYITPGLVETGKAVKEIHLEIGKRLAGTADVVILIKNSVTPFIEEGVLSVPSSGEQSEAQGSMDSRLRGNGNGVEIIWFDTAQEAHAGLKNILKPSDVILFQNDWGDQYL